MDKKRCLVLLPIGVSLRLDSPFFLAFYEHVLCPALHATGIPLAVLRGDEVLRPGMTLPNGQLWLQEPHLVVAELTTGHSGVIHDLALRPALAERTILLSQHAEHIPCRFAAYRQIIYTLSKAGLVRFQDDLCHHVRTICGPVRGDMHA